MSLEKVKLSNVKIVEQNGQYGPSYNIKFTQHLEMGQRNVSGFVKPIAFKPDAWKDGAIVELEIFQKGNYWNFKMPIQTSKQQALNDNPPILKDILSSLLRIEAMLLDRKTKLSTHEVKEFFGAEEGIPFPEEAPF